MSPIDRRNFLLQSAIGAAAFAVSPSAHAVTSNGLGSMVWLNEPASWKISGDQVLVRPKPKTDFWRNTFTGQVLDNGNFLHTKARGEFTFEGRIQASFTTQFDQASLMMRQDEETWIKCGLELFNGNVHSGVVATRGFSDWSTTRGALPWWRLVRSRDSVEVHASLDGKDFEFLRSAYIPPSSEIEVGIMCAAPEGDGFDAVFDHLKLT